MTAPDENAGEWWEPIETAPKDGTRIILAFPEVYRERRHGETKQKATHVDGKWKRLPKDMVHYRQRITIGLFIRGAWAAGRRSALPFFDEPTHWMLLPEFPDGYPEAHPSEEGDE